jgi:hypothetical protein
MSGVNFEMRSQCLPENLIHFWLVLYLNHRGHYVFISKINVADKHITCLTEGQSTAEWKDIIIHWTPLRPTVKYLLFYKVDSHSSTYPWVLWPHIQYSVYIQIWGWNQQANLRWNLKHSPPNYIPHLRTRILMHLVSMAPLVDEDPNVISRLTVRIDI